MTCLELPGAHLRSILPPPLPFFKTDTPAAILGFVRLVRGFLDLSSRLWVIIRLSNTLVIHGLDLAVKIVLEHALRPGGGTGLFELVLGFGWFWSNLVLVGTSVNPYSLINLMELT